MKKTIKLLAVLFISTLVLTSCEDNHDHDHDADHEHEEVNILRYTIIFCIYIYTINGIQNIKCI